MEKNPPLKLPFAKSLFFASMAAVITACSGGSNSGSGVLPQNDGVSNAAPTTASSASPASSTPTSAEPFSVSVSTAPVVVQSQGGGGACATTNKVMLASQPAQGDLILIYTQINSTSNTLPAPSGFSTKDAQVGSWNREAEFYKIATGSEGTTYTIPTDCSGKALSWVVADIKGENQITPFDQHKGTFNNTTGVKAFTTLSVVPSHPNDLPIGMIVAGSNGLSVASISPSNWTLGTTGAYFSEKLYSGPATGTSAIQFSETTTATSAWASFEAIDLINPANSASPAPSSTPAASPAPTPTPGAVAGAYTVGGCTVYGPNDWFTTNLVTGGSSYVSSTVDPNSASMIAYFNSVYHPTFNINGSDATMHVSAYPVNFDSTNLPLHVVQNQVPYEFSDPLNQDPTKAIPWQNGFIAQGSCDGTHGGDCHALVLDTNKCITYETYLTSGGTNPPLPWNSTNQTFTSHYLVVHSLKQPYNSQMSGGINKAQLPFIGILTTGDDEENYIAKGLVIPHVMSASLPGSDATGNTNNCASESCAVSGFVAPGSAGFGCAQFCNAAQTLPAGARLRLNQSKLSGGSCNSAYPYSAMPQANRICLQLATYGMIIVDHGTPVTGSCTPACSSSLYGVGLAPDHTGANPWNASDLSHLDGIPFTDFDVMTLGTRHT